MSDFTYNELAAVLPFTRFKQLEAHVEEAMVNKKVWIREVTGVVLKPMGQNGGKVLTVKYQPENYGQFKDPGEISAEWHPDPVNQIIGDTVKAVLAGGGFTKMRFYQINHGQTPEQERGYRKLVWIEPLAPLPETNRQDTPQESAHPQGSPPPVTTNERPQDRVQNHLAQNNPTARDEPPAYQLNEEPFRRDAGEWSPDHWGAYPS